MRRGGREAGPQMRTTKDSPKRVEQRVNESSKKVHGRSKRTRRKKMAPKLAKSCHLSGPSRWGPRGSLWLSGAWKVFLIGHLVCVAPLHQVAASSSQPLAPQPSANQTSNEQLQFGLPDGSFAADSSSSAEFGPVALPSGPQEDARKLRRRQSPFYGAQSSFDEQPQSAELRGEVDLRPRGGHRTWPFVARPDHSLATGSSLQRSLRADQQLTLQQTPQAQLQPQPSNNFALWPPSGPEEAHSSQAQQQQQQTAAAPKAGPQFTREPPSFIHYMNSSDLVIPCAASGNPAPTITWWHKSRALDVGSLLDKRYVRYDNSLVISSFRAHEFEQEIHSTSYKCQASSPLGSIVSREVVISAVIDQDYEISVADQFVSVDNDALFKCQLNAPQVRDLFQVIGWLEDGQPLANLQQLQPQTSAPLALAQHANRRRLVQQHFGPSGGPQVTRVFMLPEGHLYIRRVQLRDANKSYRCQMRNTLTGRVSTSSISGRLFVTDASESGAAPRIVESSGELALASLNEQLLLVCVAQASPRPTLRWFRQNNLQTGAPNELEPAAQQWLELTAQQQQQSMALLLHGDNATSGATSAPGSSNQKYHISPDGNLLLVRSVQLQDHGARFKCLANNSFGAAQTETQLLLDSFWPSGARPLLELEPQTVHISPTHEPHPAGQQQASTGSTSASTSASNSGSVAGRQQYVTLNCTVRRLASQPLVALEWLHNGRLLFAVQLAQPSQQLGGAGSNQLAGNSNNNLQEPFQASAAGSGLGGHHSQLLANFSAGGLLRWPSLFDEQLELQVLENQAAISAASEQELGEQFGRTDRAPMAGDLASSSSADADNQLANGLSVSSSTLAKLASASTSDSPVASFGRKLAHRPPMVQSLRPVAQQQALLYQLHLPAPLRRAQRGSYQCRARSTRSTEQAASTLLLRDSAPQFVDAFAGQLLAPSSIGSQSSLLAVSNRHSSQTSTGQQQASLKCVASGAPLPEISWTLSGFPVPESARFRVGDYVTRDGLIVSFVNITNVQPEDGGLYECTATNDVGQLRHSAWFNVTGPPVVRPMPNVSAIAGQSLSLMCPVGGWPIEQISWFQNSTKLPLNHRQKLFANGTLIVNDLNEITDSGQYSCQAKGAASDSVAVEHVHVSIKVPPVVEPFSFAKSLHRGQRYNIMCTVTRGDLPVTIRWFKDGRLLANGGQQYLSADLAERTSSSGLAEQQQQQLELQQQLQQQLSDQQHSAELAAQQQQLQQQQLQLQLQPAGIAVKQLDPYSSTLTFASLQAHHRGQYSCEAANEAGQANQSSTLMIHVPPEWRIEPRDLSVTVGKTAVIDCQADGFPATRVEWRLSQDLFREPPTEFKPIISSLYMRVFENGSLIIYNTQRSDAGYYLCQASNGIGPAISRVIKLTVHVAAHFKTKIRTELVRRGQPARLRCEAIGDPPLEISWLKDKVPLVVSSGEPGLSGLGPLLLDSGQLGETASQLGQQAASLARYAFTRVQLQDGLVSELTISESERADSALFTCISQNNFGNDDTNIQLIVQAPPEPPSDIRVQEYEARSVKLAWTAGHSGNAPLLRHVLMYAPLGHHSQSAAAHQSQSQSAAAQLAASLAGSFASSNAAASAAAAGSGAGSAEGPSGAEGRPPGGFLNATVAGNDSSCVLQNLTPLTEYQLYLVAVNSLGASRLQDEPLRFKTDDEAPSSPPLYVKAQALSSRALRVSWRAPERAWQHYGQITGFYVGYKPHLRSPSGTQSSSPLDAPAATSGALQGPLQNSGQAAASASGGSVEQTSEGRAPNADATFVYKTVEFQRRQSSPSAATSSQPPSGNKSHQAGSGAGSATGVQLVEQECQLSGLSRGQKYLVTVQAFNGRGAGPASEPVVAETWRVDVPETPLLRLVGRSSRSIQLAWRLPLGQGAPLPLASRAELGGPNASSSPSLSLSSSSSSRARLAEDSAQANEPLLGFILTHRQHLAALDQSAEAGALLGPSHELRLPADQLTHVLHNLTCGTRYSFTIAALNSVGVSQASEPLIAKTEGSPPVAPDKSSLLTLNSSSSVLINLGAWHNGACAMRAFELAFKPARSKKWTQLASFKVGGPQNGSQTVVGQRQAAGPMDSRSMLGGPQTVVEARPELSGGPPTEQQHQQQQQALANGTILLESLSASLQYELKIAATNEAGTTEQLYSFSTNPSSFAQHQRQEPLDSWAASTGGELQFPGDSGNPLGLDLLAGSSASLASLGSLLPLLLLLLFLSLLLSTGCILLARRRHHAHQEAPSSCSLSSRSNQSPQEVAGGQQAHSSTALLHSLAHQQAGHHAALMDMQMELQLDAPTKSEPNALLMQRQQQHHNQRLLDGQLEGHYQAGVGGASVRLSEIYGALQTAAHTLPSGSSSSGSAANTSASSASLVRQRQASHQHPSGSGQANELNSNYNSYAGPLLASQPSSSNSANHDTYAHLVQQQQQQQQASPMRAPHPPEAAQGEMCLGASALNLGQEAREQSHAGTLRAGLAKRAHQLELYGCAAAAQLNGQQAGQTHQLATGQTHQLASGQTMNKSATQMNLQQLRSATLPSGGCQQQLLLDSLAAASAQLQHAEAAEVAATYEAALQAALQQQQHFGSPNSHNQQQHQFSSQLASFIDQHVQQQVYATVKRGCPRPARLCDHSALGLGLASGSSPVGPVGASLYQCAQSQPLSQSQSQSQAQTQSQAQQQQTECCSGDLCYAHELPSDQAQLLACAQQHQVNGDYQQLRPSTQLGANNNNNLN